MDLSLSQMDDTTKFLRRLGISHVRSRPRYPQSNGMMERLHRLLRERLRGLRSTIAFSHRLRQVLMDIRNSQHRMIGTAPSEALFSRVLRTRVPTHIDSVIINPSHQVRAKARMAEDQDAHRGVGPLPSLKPGTIVVLQDGYNDPTKRWKVVEQYGQQVRVSDGQHILLRNRLHVREYHARAQMQEDMGISDTLQAQSPSNRAEAIQMRASGSEDPGLPITGVTSMDRESVTAENCTSGTLQTIPKTASPEATTDVLPPCHQPRESLFREGMVTRSGRQVKLITKAFEKKQTFRIFWGGGEDWC